MPAPASPADRETGEQFIEQGVATLYQAARARVKDLAERFAPDLQPATYGILRYIMEHEPLRAGDIVAALGIDKSAVSRQIGTLREMGLIDMRPDPEDGRASLLVASTRAREARVVYRAETSERYASIFREWTDEEIISFAVLLGKFNESID